MGEKANVEGGGGQAVEGESARGIGRGDPVKTIYLNERPGTDSDGQSDGAAKRCRRAEEGREIEASVRRVKYFRGGSSLWFQFEVRGIPHVLAGNNLGGLDRARFVADLAKMIASAADLMGDAPFCSLCGHVTVRNGACYKCLNCGNSMGCS